MSVAPASLQEANRIEKLIAQQKAQLTRARKAEGEMGHPIMSSRAIRALEESIKKLTTQRNNIITQANSRPSSTSSRSSGGGSSRPAPAPAVDPAAVENMVREKYGYLSAYLDNPEIGPILKKAAQEGWGSAELQGALYKTNWWKTTSGTARLWDAKVTTDPATAKQEITSKAAELWDLSRRMGANINSDQVKNMATDALRLGWSQSEIVDRIAGEINYHGALSGMAGQAETQINQLANDYGIAVGDSSREQWIKQVVSGEREVEDYRRNLIDQAKGTYRGWADDLDHGTTVTQLADPYKQLAMKTLGIQDSDWNVTDPKWQRILIQQQKDGTSRAMDIADAQREFRSNAMYGFEQSDQGRNEVSGFLAEMQNKFGMTSV